MTLHRNDKVVQTRDVVAVDTGDEVVLLGLDQNAYFSFVGTARSIWCGIQEPVSVAKLVDTLRAEHDVDEEACLADTLEFLERLQAEKLIDIEAARN